MRMQWLHPVAVTGPTWANDSYLGTLHSPVFQGSQKPSIKEQEEAAQRVWQCV